LTNSYTRILEHLILKTAQVSHRTRFQEPAQYCQSEWNSNSIDMLI